MKRIRSAGSNSLFLPATNVATRFSSGCALLDCVIGGGWPRGRVSNIVGDFSSGKTLLSIEACANFAREVPDGKIVYCETEAAFDSAYAQSVGLPFERVEFPNDPEGDGKQRIDTVEGLISDVKSRLTEAKKDKRPTLYVVDSMDALSDQAEKDRDPEKGTYGAAKPKLLSEFFRTRNADMANADFTLLIVSQVRDAIGVTWGKKHRRSGGKALDFYASLVLWLAKIGAIKVTRKKVARSIGVKIKAKTEKCKVGMPFRECEFPIYFQYGVEDVEAAFDWLKEVGFLSDAKERVGYASAEEVQALDPNAHRKARKRLAALVSEKWLEVEERFRPTRSKYG